MFFVMKDFQDSGKFYPRRIGQPTNVWEDAVRKALRYEGYIVDERNRLKGQVTHPNALCYIGKKNISSGEDCVLS